MRTEKEIQDKIAELTEARVRYSGRRLSLNFGKVKALLWVMENQSSCQKARRAE